MGFDVSRNIRIVSDRNLQIFYWVYRHKFAVSIQTYLSKYKQAKYNENKTMKPSEIVGWLIFLLL